ncbi:MAG TPA: hypothetical protein VKP69_09560, partial [Isosphaeraceae bacterium]|nr:hypothetical protein [Isosphaeraceae bacterium]
VALTPALRAAAGAGLLRDSAQQTGAQIDARAGELGVLAKTTVLEIVRQEGQRPTPAPRRSTHATRRPFGCSSLP